MEKNLRVATRHLRAIPTWNSKAGLLAFPGQGTPL
jgi:hypothetical protein